MTKTAFRRPLGPVAGLLLMALAGCSGLPGSVTGPETETALQQATLEMCTGPKQGEVQTMKELYQKEEAEREETKWQERQLASGSPPQAVDRLTEALVLFSEQGDPQEVEGLILEAMRMEEDQLAPLAQARIASAGLLANLYTQERRFEDAIPLERYIVALNTRAYGPFYEPTVDHMMRLAILELQNGRVLEANERYNCARNAAAALWGTDSEMLRKLDEAYRRLAETG